MTQLAEPKQQGGSIPDHPGRTGHFGLLNAFVDDGHQGRLMGVRSAVWLTYLRHADGDACACPSNDTLARAAGHSQSRHVREARAELVRLGYLVDTGRIHPKYKTTIYRLTLPRIGAPCPESGHGAPIPPDTLPLFRASPCPDSAENPAPNRGTKQLIQQPIQQPIQQRRRDTKGAAGGEGGGDDFAVTIPAVLDTPAFREAWAAWLKHKRERREKMTPTAQGRAMKMMAGWTDGAGPAARAVAAIDHSLARNWQGIFEERDQGRGAGGRPASAPRRTAAERGEYHRPMPVRVREL